MVETVIDRRAVLIATGLLGVAFAYPATAQTKSYATKPIRIIVGNPPGGGNDIIARLIAPIMSEELGQPITVENRPGAAGGIGLSAVVKSQPDGHTLFCSSSAIIATNHTYVNKLADPVADLEHITTIASGDFIFTINAEVPAKDYAEFLALAKAQPEKFKVGSPGAGGNIHLLGELFKIRSGLKLRTVHYSLTSALITDFLANEIQVGINALSQTEAHIRSGKLRPLFIASQARAAELPNIPTSVELGFKDLHTVSNWVGLHAPKGTPPAVLDQIYQAAVKATNAEGPRQRLIAAGYRPIADTPVSFRARIDADDRTFAEVAKAADVRVD